MLVGAFLPRMDPGAQALIQRSGHIVKLRTSSMHRTGEYESFDCVVVLTGDPSGELVAKDYEHRGVEVRRLARDQLATLGEGSANKDGGRWARGDEGLPASAAPEAAAEAAPDAAVEPAAEEPPAQQEPEAPEIEGGGEGTRRSESTPSLDGMKRSELIRYASGKYPGAVPNWLRYVPGDAASLRQKIRELGG
jgi:hypothetical protein